MQDVLFSVLTVQSKTYLTPHYIRIILTGSEADIRQFEQAGIGDNNKIFIPQQKDQPVAWPGYTRQESDPGDIAPGLPPYKRTYTLRQLDSDNRTMTIDFVAHGANGPGSCWAIEARPGDQLGVGMKARRKLLLPEAQQYLLVGDITALPVIAVMLEKLPAMAQATVLLEVPQSVDEQILCSPADVHIHWIYNPQPEKEDRLSAALENIVLPREDVTRFAFVAAESSAVKAIRRILLEARGWSSAEARFQAYWKAGEAE